jgi:hypothetical protein
VSHNFRNQELKQKASNFGFELIKHSPRHTKDDTLMLTSTDVEIDFHSNSKAPKGSFDTNQILKELNTKERSMKR